MLVNKEIEEQIRVVSEELGLDAFVIEKDLYLTHVISLVTQVPHEHFDLVFQGGTCLAKAGIVHRMSEDCDFRIRLKDTEEKLGKEFIRKALRTFRHQLIDALRNHDYKLNEEDIHVRNEGQFMGLRVQYPSMYASIAGIKPYLAIEFFQGKVRKPIEQISVTTLIQQTLGEKVNHLSFIASSIATIETAAEKWVALTRRVATSSLHEHYRDMSLVRHLYDLYEIEQAGLFNTEFEKLTAEIVMSDRQQFKNHNANYYIDPIKEIQRAIEELHINPSWQANWNNFISTMVFKKEKPTYQAVLKNITEKTQQALTVLQKIDI